MEYRVAAAVVTGLLGLIFLIGFFKALRQHLHLGLLGLSFIALGANMLVPASLAWVKWTLWGLTGLFFAGAVLFAAAQTLVQIRLLQEHRRGREAEMWAYLEEVKRRTGQTEEKPPADRGE